MLKRLLGRFLKSEDPKVAAEKESIGRDAQQAAIRADVDAGASELRRASVAVA